MSLAPLALLIHVLPEPTLLVTGHGALVAANQPALALFQLSPATLQQQNLAALVTNPPEQMARYLDLWSRNRQLIPAILLVRAAPPTATEPTSSVVRYRCLGAVVQPWSVQEPALLFLRLELQTEASSKFRLLTQKIAELSREVRERLAAEQALRTSEERLRELNATLEQRVRMRTAELERSNEELDQFAYVASHDLKAPLRHIDQLALWIEEDSGVSLPTAAQKYLRQLRQRVKRMERLLDDLLTYARIGRVEEEVEVVDVSALVEDVIYLLAPPTGFVIEKGEMPTLRTVRTPLALIFRNLIGNAIKHHHQPSQGRLQISKEVNEHVVRFYLQDNGPGIAPQYHERIFGMFQTLQSRDQIEGSGMGLAIVKKAVERQGGTIAITSTVGIGTTFAFTWPAPIMAHEAKEKRVVPL